MKNITINLPEDYVEYLDNHYENRSEIIRTAIGEFLTFTLDFKEALKSQKGGVHH